MSVAPTLSRADLASRDAHDPLASTRSLFDLPEGIIYLDGNSLGPLPTATKARLLDTVTREWGQDLIRSWTANDWIGLPRRVGDLIAGIIGAKKGEVIAADSTSVNLFKLLAAALHLRPGRTVILSEPGNFPTDLYMAQGLAGLVGGAVSLRTVRREDLAAALTEDVAVLLLTHVHYKTGEIHDMAALTAAAHRVGALALWDLSHSAGALDLDLNAAGADLAVGCGYKYLNGGPGAPAFLFVAEQHQAAARQPLSGWMGHAAPFDFVDTYAPAPGIDRHLCGTPSVLGMVALEEGCRITASVDMATLRAKSRALGDLFLELVQRRCGDVFGILCPHDSARRGNQVSLTHADGYAIIQALIARGVIGDFRSPNVLRFGFAPLYLRYVDMWDAVDHLAAVMQTEEYRQPQFQVRATVT